MFHMDKSILGTMHENLCYEGVLPLMPCLVFFVTFPCVPPSNGIVAAISCVAGTFRHLPARDYFKHPSCILHKLDTTTAHSTQHIAMVQRIVHFAEGQGSDAQYCLDTVLPRYLRNIICFFIIKCWIILTRKKKSLINSFRATIPKHYLKKSI